MAADLAKIRHVVLDMDGTIYLGGTLLADTLPFLSSLARLGIGHSYVTNNCSRSRAEYVGHLREIGIAATADSILTSAHATIHHLNTQLPGAKRLFVFGTPGLHDDFRLAGFEIVDDRPDAVVVGFDTALTYDRLAQTAYWISRGLPYVATHPDRVCPTDRPIVLPDCGAICSLLETATGRRPDAVPGKPNPLMLEAVFAQYEITPQQVALVGDRLYTDIRMARDAGAVAVLTLTGETKRADVESCPQDQRPDLVVANLGEFRRLLESAPLRKRGGMIANVFSLVRRFYAAPPTAPPLPKAAAASLYPTYRLRALESTYIGYAVYYLVRNNVSFVTVELQNGLGYTKEMIGDITAMTALAYGLSKFLMGSVSDKSNSRRFIATGLFLTAICNFAFGASTSFYAHLGLWTLNGFAQGMGWPPCGRVMGHWFSESERGLTFSFWNTSHNLGAGIIGVFVAWVVGEFGGWQYAFYVPGAIAAVISVYLFLRVPDTPASVGLPPIEEFRNDYPVAAETVDLDRELSIRELLFDKVLLNKWIWLLAIANFFVYICRYSMMDWSPTYLREVKEVNISKGAYAVMILEFSAIPSTIFFGWVSDRIGGRRGMVATLCMIPIIAAFAGIIAAPKGHVWIDYLMLGAIGCFVYPVLGLITVAALDMVSKKAIGAAAGFIGLFGYLGRVVQDKGFGRLLDQLSDTHGKEYAWDVVLYIIMFCAILATLLLALLWKLRPQA